jgi:hypothetical protein
MVHHWLSRRRDTKPDFPERADLQHLTDKEADAALSLLRLLVSGGQADVYTRPLARARPALALERVGAGGKPPL